MTASPSANPHLSIIIVSWNVEALLRDCLRSVEQNRADFSLQIIVVDSASSDGTVGMVQSEFPWVELLACDENVGFPRGNNLGIANARGDFVLLLNPDTVVKDNALAILLDYLKAMPSVGLVGPQLLNEDGSVQSSRRRFPTLLTAFFESTWLEPYAPAQLLERFYVADVADAETAVVDWVTGACMMLPRSVIEAVGGMDEHYFMYSEELDWCRRIQAAGWQIVYHPAAKVVHLSGKSSEQAVTHRHINFQRAKLRYFRKYHGVGSAALLRLFLLGGYLWQILVEGVKGVVGHKRPLRWQRIQSYWQVVRSGLRPAGF